MSGFSFPPPPPPPPKANPIDGQQNLPQRGGHDRGRGRGSRGNSQQRGRGQPGGRGSGAQGYYQQGRAQQYQNGNSFSVKGEFSSAAAESNANHGNYVSSTGAPQRPTSSHGQRPPTGSPSRTTAGHKRKLDALRGPPQKKPEKKPAPATAPAIPTFGAPFLPTASTTRKIIPPATSNNHLKQPPQNRGLGLTPGTGDAQYSSSDDEDEDRELDEEALYAELGDKLTFEHNGVVMSLNSQADLLSWKKDRQKNWPTRSRMATKDDERRKVGEERKRLLAGVKALYGTKSRFSAPGSNIWSSVDAAVQQNLSETEEITAMSEHQALETGLEKAKREMAEKTRRLEDLRKKVTESEAKNRKAREQVQERQAQQDDASASSPSADVGLKNAGEFANDKTAMTDETEAKSGAQDLVNYSSSPGLSPSSSSDSSSAIDSSDDEPPEETSSRAPALVDVSTEKTRPVCRYFRNSGRCRDGDACQFQHDPADQQQQHRMIPHQQHESRKQGHVRKDERPPRLEQKSEKKTIFQRLVEQEEEGDDLLALKVVRYLGEAGFFT